MKGFSAQQPQTLIRLGGSYQFRTNIEQFEKELEDGTTETQYKFDYINVPFDDPESREFKKYIRDAMMAQAVVTTANGNTFDADEKSQERMSRTLNVAQLTGQTSTSWVLANNTSAVIDKAELGEALGLAMQLQNQVWFL